MLWLMRMMNDFLKNLHFTSKIYIIYIIHILGGFFKHMCKHQLTSVQPVEGKKVKTDL